MNIFISWNKYYQGHFLFRHRIPCFCIELCQKKSISEFLRVIQCVWYSRGYLRQHQLNHEIVRRIGVCLIFYWHLQSLIKYKNGFWGSFLITIFVKICKKFHSYFFKLGLISGHAKHIFYRNFRFRKFSDFLSSNAQYKSNSNSPFTYYRKFWKYFKNKHAKEIIVSFLK